MAVSGIYQIFNILDHKRYIGSTVDIHRRFYEHKRCLKGLYHYNKKLQNSINKNGIENFTFLVLEECSKEELETREKYWIDFIKPEYNGTYVIEKRWAFDDESKKKLSESQIKRWASIDIEKKKQIVIKVGRKHRKSVLQYSLKGEYINEFESITEAGKSLKLKPSQYSSISKVCKGREGRTQAYNYVWKYKLLVDECIL